MRTLQLLIMTMFLINDDDKNLDEKNKIIRKNKNKKKKRKTQNTNNRYAPLENMNESFNKSFKDNLLQSEINVATQDQINCNVWNQERKKALIIGNSMVKDIKIQKINKKLKFTNGSVKCFPGANTSDMKYYIKPPIKKKPNAEVVIIHTGTNDLSSEFTPTKIATNIMDLATDLKKNLNQSCDLIISSIILRGDQLQQKVVNVNK